MLFGGISECEVLRHRLKGRVHAQRRQHGVVSSSGWLACWLDWLLTLLHTHFTFPPFGPCPPTSLSVPSSSRVLSPLSSYRSPHAQTHQHVRTSSKNPQIRNRFIYGSTSFRLLVRCPSPYPTPSTSASRKVGAERGAIGWCHLAPARTNEEGGGVSARNA